MQHQLRRRRLPAASNRRQPDRGDQLIVQRVSDGIFGRFAIDTANDSASTTSTFTIKANTAYVVLLFRNDATATNDLSSITTTGFTGSPTFGAITSQSLSSDVHEWAYDVTGGASSNGPGSITANFSAAAGKGAVTIVEVVQLTGSNPAVPVVPASESAMNCSGTTATANLNSKRRPPATPTLVLLGATSDLTTEPAPSPAMTSEFYSDQKPGTAAVYFASVATQNESITIANTTWATLALEVNTAP